MSLFSDFVGVFKIALNNFKIHRLALKQKDFESFVEKNKLDLFESFYQSKKYFYKHAIVNDFCLFFYQYDNNFEIQDFKQSYVNQIKFCQNLNSITFGGYDSGKVVVSIESDLVMPRMKHQIESFVIDLPLEKNALLVFLTSCFINQVYLKKNMFTNSFIKKTRTLTPFLENLPSDFPDSLALTPIGFDTLRKFYLEIDKDKFSQYELLYYHFERVKTSA